MFRGNLTNGDHFQGQDFSFDADIQGERSENNDNNDHSEFEEANSEIIPKCDLDYPPLTKWTRDHMQSQVTAETSTSNILKTMIKIFVLKTISFIHQLSQSQP